MLNATQAPLIMSKTELKNKNYVPATSFDATNWTKRKLIEELDKASVSIDRGEYSSVDSFFSRFEKEHNICAQG